MISNVMLEMLLCKINKVTSYYRHGLKIPERDLTELSNYQIAVEAAISKAKKERAAVQGPVAEQRHLLADNVPAHSLPCPPLSKAPADNTSQSETDTRLECDGCTGGNPAACNDCEVTKQNRTA